MLCCGSFSSVGETLSFRPSPILLYEKVIKNGAPILLCFFSFSTLQIFLSLIFAGMSQYCSKPQACCFLTSCLFSFSCKITCNNQPYSFFHESFHTFSRFEGESCAKCLNVLTTRNTLFTAAHADTRAESLTISARD